MVAAPPSSTTSTTTTPPGDGSDEQAATVTGTLPTTGTDVRGPVLIALALLAPG